MCIRDRFKGTLYRQTMFAEFERACGRLTQQGETMTAERLNSLYYDLNKAYFGPDMVSDEAIALEWSRCLLYTSRWPAPRCRAGPPRPARRTGRW